MFLLVGVWKGDPWAIGKRAFEETLFRSCSQQITEIKQRRP
jgi:hypothetical protein